MSIYSIIAAFGGGLFAASIGALPAFIMTGVFAVVGAALGLAGAGAASAILFNNIAFGPFFGPWASFAAGAVAASYAKKKGYTENGADIVTALGGLNAPDVLVVGGVAGVIGWVLKYYIVDVLFAQVIGVGTDGGMVVVLMGILARLAFGGPIKTGDKWLPSGKALMNSLTVGVGYSILIAFVFATVVTTADAETVELFLGNFAVLAFGTAAVGLIFAQAGFAFIGCHHIFIMTASACAACYASSGNVMMSAIAGVVVGVVSNILCDLDTVAFNSGTDSHVDGPGFAIFIMTIVVNLIW